MNITEEEALERARLLVRKFPKRPWEFEAATPNLLDIALSSGVVINTDKAFFPYGALTERTAQSLRSLAMFLNSSSDEDVYDPNAQTEKFEAVSLNIDFHREKAGQCIDLSLLCDLSSGKSKHTIEKHIIPYIDCFRSVDTVALVETWDSKKDVFENDENPQEYVLSEPNDEIYEGNPDSVEEKLKIKKFFMFSSTVLSGKELINGSPLFWNGLQDLMAIAMEHIEKNPSDFQVHC